MQTKQLANIVREGAEIVARMAEITRMAQEQLNCANDRIKWARRGEVPLDEIKAVDSVRFSAENTVVNADAAVLAAAIALQVQLAAEISKLTGKKEGNHE